MEDVIGGLAEIGRAVGWYFGAAFLVIVAAWVQFLVRWGDERRELGISRTVLERLISELEQPKSALFMAVVDRFRGSQGDLFPGREQFEDWFRHVQGASARNEGVLFLNYLWGMLSTRRNRLLASDNRVGLAGVRNELKSYRYHRWLNFGLANTAVSLGILGTVTGLWGGFNQIDFSGGDVPAVMEEVMKSLSQALFTTAIGVLISIPIVITGLKMEQQLEEMYGMVCELQNALVATLLQLER